MRSAQVPQPNQSLHRRFHRGHPKHQQSAPPPIFPPHLRWHHNTLPTKTRGQTIPETTWLSTICDHRHSVRQTNTRPAQLVHVICIQTPRPKASRNQRATGYPPRLVSTHSTCGTPPHPRQRTRRAPVSLPWFCRCIQMGSQRSLVRRHETTNPNSMVLRMASNNQEPILLGVKQNWVTHNIGPGTNRHTPPVACP
jgi:hypothetical protein